MKTGTPTRRFKRRATAIAMGGTLFHIAALPLGGCELQDITTTTTLNGREVFLSLARNAIVTPIDQALTHGITELLAELSDDE